ncbi:Gfo/Idh/MocA family protein [Saccharothrix australiensis]|uniref:Putative dehydrogenase n=1 Tax=Saccharothrix australiensis TaxID=2072 RepID=A0A495W1J0_9PSEU|nr:Gfo/Idh/MocA family oxidoreductase [Saccharothrix australiensis]RKT55532.1 putative dehydrogenase [Saccharothrix australiensis]
MSDSPSPRIGLFGHGWWCAKYLAPALRGAGAELAAVCGRDAGRAAAAASALGVPRSFDRLDAMLDSVELDGVVIASPPSSHAGAALGAAARGLAVFCEKPLARDAEESARMVQACAGVPGVAGFTQRWNPAIRTARRLLAEGAAGEVRHLRYTTASVLAADPSTPWDWRHDPSEYSYGVLSDLGPHAVDLVRWLVGEVDEVSATATTVTTRRPAEGGGTRPVGNWDDCALSLRLASGARASVTASRVLPPSPYRRFRHALEVIGSAGALAYDSDRPAEVVLTASGAEPKVIPADGPTLGDVAPGSFEEMLAVTGHAAAHQARDVLATFAGAAPEGVPSLADGHAAQLVLDVAARAVAERSWVACAPA